MGGECYRYCSLKPGVSVTEEENVIYQGLLPSILADLEVWFANEDPGRWTVTFDGDTNALELQVKDDKLFEGKIVLPKHLDHSLRVGWQHRHYGSDLDPKYDVATKIMDSLTKSELKSIIEDDEEDNVANDLGLNDYRDNYSEGEEQSKGPFHYSRGISDLSWSPHGLYGGYDDWETYREANGLDD